MYILQRIVLTACTLNPEQSFSLNLLCLPAWLDYDVGSSQWEASENYQWCPPSRDSYTAREGIHTHLSSTQPPFFREHCCMLLCL